MNSSLSVISIVNRVFSVGSKKTSPYPSSFKFSPMVCFSSFIVLRLGLWSFFFELMVVKNIIILKIIIFKPYKTCAFELQCWRRLLRVPWTARRSSQSILKEISSEYSLESLMLNWLIGKDPDAGKDWMQDEKGTTEDEMVGWHHRLSGHEFKQVPVVGDAQGSLACCSPQGSRVRHDWATELTAAC